MSKEEILITDEMLKVEIERLKKIEAAANAVVRAFTNGIDYNTWDKALDRLEEALKEKA